MSEVEMLKAQLAEAVGLLKELRPTIPKDVLSLWCADRDAFLARHAQPAALEPVAYCDDFTLGKLKSGLAYSVGVTPAAQRYPNDVHALYVVSPAPPAAAIGCTDYIGPHGRELLSHMRGEK